jgi:hypothetical protein
MEVSESGDGAGGEEGESRGQGKADGLGEADYA